MTQDDAVSIVVWVKQGTPVWAKAYKTLDAAQAGCQELVDLQYPDQVLPPGDHIAVFTTHVD